MNTDQEEYLAHRQNKVNYPEAQWDRLESEKRILKHEWLQILVVTVTVFGLFLWMRGESRSDYRHLVTITDSIRQDAKDFREMWAKETKEFNEKWAKESKEFNEKWANESKEFHGRLVAIEERGRK